MDLLGKDRTKKLDIREDPKIGIFVKDLNLFQVNNSNEIENCLTLGNKNRHVGETTMNLESSRSHCIFTVYVEIGENMDDQKNKKIKAGKLNLVDLAGSERQSKTNATGSRLDEAKKINLSLTALSNVINALVENKQHVPYRDSKLTRLLQDSLGGNTKTVMVAAISPSSFNYDETVSTLRYAARANAIKNAPKINEDPKDALLRQYEEQIKLLKDQLGGGSGSISNLQISSEGLSEDVIRQLEKEKRERMDMESKLNEKEQLLANNNLEKEKMKIRIMELEKEMERKLIKGGDEKDDKEKRKFKEYREKQIKAKDESKRKKDMIEEKRKEEEESLQNDVNKLRNKTKYLESEIRDLRYENERDREDMMETIKELNKESKLYHGMLKIMLSDAEIKRIIELSKYNEENDQWKIQPYHFKDKKLLLPTIKPHLVADFVENEINSRDMILEEYSSAKNNNNTTRSNKFMVNNKDSMRETKSNFTKNISNNINTKNAHLEPINTNKKQSSNNTGSNNNLFILNKKEAKKYEELIRNSQNVNISPVALNLIGSNNLNNNVQTHSVSKAKMGKVILDPIGVTSSNFNHNPNNLNQSKSNFYQDVGNNKMEVSFKATLQFTDRRVMNNKIEISPNINLHNPNITNVNKKGIRLEKIPESRNNDLDIDYEEY